MPPTNPNDQAPVQQKQVPSTSAVISPHQPDSYSDLEADMEADPADALDVRPTEEEVKSSQTRTKTLLLPN